MKHTVYDELRERGFVAQVAGEESLREILTRGITCYIGFDPTAAALHVGHLLPIMGLMHMQRYGHRPIILVGGGTAMIGDPSGKNEMRRILSAEEIAQNADKIKKQFSRYIDFENNRALMLNNAEWLLPLPYIEFLRDIGKHFSVNRMIASESYRMRLETGLNFIEFNYMLLQAYDFLHLYQQHGCVLQMGGNDQWGNIVAGIELVRRVAGATVYSITFPLITTAAGHKMGKTESGAIWLDETKTSPYEFYQYWFNTDDRDVEKFLLLFTLLPVAEIRQYAQHEGSNLQKAKELLAFEATRITHGIPAAEQARESARNIFYGEGTDIDSLPVTCVELERLKNGIAAYLLFEESKLCSSRAEARRLIQDGGAYINGRRVQNFDETVREADLKNGLLVLRAGKKRYHRITVN
jgi:tyrosyl-tRNA synthetase